ncbi:MAG: glycine cleavage system aminomethyltransferase GcvT [Thermoplasmata archaeon]|nr:glycine cleavage system aminomethyltransferase GcvT [Euryarchaeota archaeon]MVT35802.1 glycine cleavage system aminomethyltransferase GcvT [Euryarchaeota archaeon]
MAKKTPLYDEHVNLGAKMIEFAGFLMPLEYTGIIDEHLNVRKNVGIFDVSHMGDIVIEGKDSEKFLDYLLPTKVSSMQNLEAKYSAYLNEKGIMLDDTIVYKVNSEKFLLVPNAATAEKIYKWILDKSSGYNIKIYDRSLLYSSIAVQGPKAIKLMEKLTKYDYSKMKSFTFDFITFMDIENRGDNFIPYGKIFVSRTGYTGEDGVELIFPNEYAVEIWQSLLDYGKEFGIKPCGLGARDTLRMEKGMLLSGTDFNMDRTPIEASISWIINYDHDFIGKEALLEIKNKDHEIFRGFKMLEPGIPRHGYNIYKNENKIGIITSGTMSPSLKVGIGLGYVKKDVKVGDIVLIDIRGKKMKAEVTKPKIHP